MILSIHRIRRSFDQGVLAFAGAVLGLLALYWTSAELLSVGLPMSSVQAATGLFLLLFAPGALLTQLLHLRAETFGTLVLFSVGLSVGVLGLIAVFVGAVLPVLGFASALSFFPLAVALTVVLSVLVALVSLTRTTITVPRVRLTGSLPVVVALLALPTLAALGVVVMEQFGTNAGMFLFVAAVLGVVLLSATRYLPASLYPLAVSSVSISTLLHRNLLTNSVVGADIQSSYYVSRLMMRTNHWGPELGGSQMAIPVVNAVPASLSILTGIELAVVFKVIYVFVFSLVPVGVYYVGSRLFDDHVGLFGGLFLVFYHGSFYFTPGKQLVSELFVVALVLLFVRGGLNETRHAIGAGLLGSGLVLTHYGMTYVVGIALLIAVVGLFATRRVVGDFDHDLSLWHPVGLLVGATAWYAYASPELVARVASVPLGMVDQIVTLILTGAIEGSGSSYVAGPESLLSALTLYLYFLFTGLIGVGLAWKVLTQLRDIWNNREPEHVEYTAFAVPFFVFLGSSYFVIANLWADRVYQMVLPVLGPFMVVGYGALTSRATPIRKRLHVPNWLVLAVLLAALVTLNSGLAFSLAGSSALSTFNGEAHDLAFDESERDAVVWLDSNSPAITEYSRPSAADAASSTGAVPIYTDAVSYQLFRSTIPAGYSNAETVRLKSRFQPTIFPSTIGDGYVYIRERGVVDASPEDVPPSVISRSSVNEITTPRNVVFTNGGATIVETDNASASSW